MEKNGSKESLKPTFNKNNANLPIVPQNLHDPAPYFRQKRTKIWNNRWLCVILIKMGIWALTARK